MGWAHEQRTCPAGHDVRWPAGKASHEACDCANVKDGRGHHVLWCEACRRFYGPPGCTKY